MGAGAGIVVYTAVFGGHDALWSVCPTETEARFVAYVDEPLQERGNWGQVGERIQMTDDGPAALRMWEQVVVKPGYGPRRTARHFKAMPHAHLEADISIWVDGNVRLLVSPETVVERWLSRDMATFRHPDRGDLFEEAEFCAQKGKDSRDVLEKQVARYKKDGMPPRWGLPETRVLVRRNVPEIREMCERWWDELREHSVRDQVSLPYVCWKTGVVWDRLPGRCWVRNESPYWYYVKHTKRGKR